MKNLLIIANCFGGEYWRHLASVAKIREEFSPTFVSTYEQTPDARYHALLEDADVIVSQNVKNIPAYANAYIAEHKKQNALHVSTEFWRFDGYWPYSSASHRINDWFWFPVDEFGTEISYENYMNHELDRVVVREHFETELEKLREIDGRSDISIMEFFMANHQNDRLFSDHWHPLPPIYKRVAEELLNRLDIKGQIPDLPADGVNDCRHRLILRSVRESLRLRFGEETFTFLGRRITPEDYFYFARFLLKSPGFVDLPSIQAVKARFDDFFGVPSV